MSNKLLCENIIWCDYLRTQLDNCHNWEMLGNLITANFQCLKFKVVPSGQIEI